MADQPLTLNALVQFHRDVVAPDLDRIVSRLDVRFNALRDEMLSNFDAIYKRFDRLESEYRRCGLPSSASRCG